MVFPFFRLFRFLKNNTQTVVYQWFELWFFRFCCLKIEKTENTQTVVYQWFELWFFRFSVYSVCFSKAKN
jgi:hypothetical protein